MLKGKRVLTPDYFGIVLNDAEREPALILAVRRVRRQQHYSGSYFVAAHTVEWWVVADDVMILPWNKAGIMRVCERMPKWLHLRALRNRN